MVSSVVRIFLLVLIVDWIHYFRFFYREKSKAKIAELNDLNVEESNLQSEADLSKNSCAFFLWYQWKPLAKLIYKYDVYNIYTVQVAQAGNE